MKTKKVKMRVAKTKPKIRKLRKDTIRWSSPSDFMKFLNVLHGVHRRKGFVTLKKSHYTELDWQTMLSHVEVLYGRGSIHNYRTYKGGRNLSIKLRPHHNNH